ncbi:hypothetical protein DMN91_008862 [Ooceraea biroi]|uniref:Uncharacterized protein n=1 Tax=Ooceraea biroi TaxID=2015173 RepID=A0A3L8DDG0_OOCBI|nr:hypothetical protein DMN91_008862 [Ooceraea biroi]
MLDTGEHRLGGDPSQQQPHQLHHPQHQQPHPLQHHPQSVASECNPRFLVPNAPSVENVHPNRTRHKLSRSQVSSNEYFSVSFEMGDDAAATFEREEFLPATRGTYLAEVLGAACERRGVDLSHVEVLDSSSSTSLPLLTTETFNLGGRHLRITIKDEKSNSRTPCQRGNQNVSLRKTSGARVWSILFRHCNYVPSVLGNHCLCQAPRYCPSNNYARAFQVDSRNATQLRLVCAGCVPDESTWSAMSSLALASIQRSSTQTQTELTSINRDKY